MRLVHPAAAASLPAGPLRLRSSPTHAPIALLIHHQAHRYHEQRCYYH